MADLCCGAGIKAALLARTSRVIAVDILEERLHAARANARLFGVSDAVEFKQLDLSQDGALSELGKVDAIFIDPDWRDNIAAPIVRHSRNPLHTNPPLDSLYRAIRRVYADTQVIFEVSPRADPDELAFLGKCLIEEIHINGRFVLHHVSFLRGLRSITRRVVRL